MRVTRVELSRHRIPFRRAFVHAAASRATGDAIIVEVETDAGVRGFGEIQARPYVTGESNDDVWSRGAPGLARSLIGKEFDDPLGVRAALGGPAAYRARPALTGGFDIALVDALDVRGRVDWSDLFGPPRRDPPGRCLTIGGDASGEGLRRQARFARLGGCAVVKLKVRGPDDAPRCLLLREALGSGVRIRLDGNGRLSLNAAVELLEQAREAKIESIEEPLDRSGTSYVQDLVRLRERTGVDTVADESVWTPQDLERFAGTGAFRYVNVRAGKCGGVNGTATFLRTARDLGYDVVSGTMVGETAVLLRVSEKLLGHCSALTYVEGLDQADTLLESQVVRPVADRRDRHFVWDADARRRYEVGCRAFCRLPLAPGP